MICKACGKVVPDNSVYCPQCGVPLGIVDVDNGTAGNGSDNNYNANYNNMSQKEKEEQDFIQSKLNQGRLYGVVSIVCSILGLGSFGTLDVIAIICGWLGLKQLKFVPNTNPEKNLAVTLNRAGIICSAGLIILGIFFVVIALVAFPWVFAGIASFFAGLI